MTIHTFILAENGRQSVLKKFLHMKGNRDIPKDLELSNALCEVHTITVISSDDNAKEIAREIVLQKKLPCIEGYNCSNFRDQLRFADVSNITTVSDIQKTNQGIDALSNDMFAFIYPKEFANHSIYRYDYVISYKQKTTGEVKYAIDEDRDEIIFSMTDKLQSEILMN